MKSKELGSESILLDNMEELLTPFSGDNLCGEYLKRSPILIKIKELRNKLIKKEDNLGVWVKKEEESLTWDDIVNHCEDFLLNHSKDLQVCAYLSEAKLYTSGFMGLAGSLSLILSLCNEFWENVNPPYLDQDKEVRLAPFRWLQINLPLLIQRTPLVKGVSLEEGITNLSWFWYQSETSTSSSDGIKAKDLFASYLEKINHSELTSVINSLKSIAATLNEIENEYLNLFDMDSLEEPFTYSDCIELCMQIIKFVEMVIPVKENKDSNYLLSDSMNKDNLKKDKNNSNSFVANSKVSSIEEAYKTIEMANKFLLENDPHSPSPYMIRRALDWRKKSLYGVLMELFTTTSKPQEIFTLLGLTHLDKNNLEN